jgi:hypothetical protein
VASVAITVSAVDSKDAGLDATVNDAQSADSGDGSSFAPLSCSVGTGQSYVFAYGLSGWSTSGLLFFVAQPQDAGAFAGPEVYVMDEQCKLYANTDVALNLDSDNGFFSAVGSATFSSSGVLSFKAVVGSVDGGTVTVRLDNGNSPPISGIPPISVMVTVTSSDALLVALDAGTLPTGGLGKTDGQMTSTDGQGNVFTLSSGSAGSLGTLSKRTPQGAVSSVALPPGTGLSITWISAAPSGKSVVLGGNVNGSASVPDWGIKQAQSIVPVPQWVFGAVAAP